jgi:hypothetical protein
MFHEMGRLHYATVQTLDGDPERTVYGELRALAGDRPRKEIDSAISNASYASRVYAVLVVPGRLSEEEFEALTFADCLAAVRAAQLPPVTRRRRKLRRRPRQSM